MKLLIEIEFGNDAMLRYSQARAVIADGVGTSAYRAKPAVGDGHSLRDVNGNRVGKWEVVEDDVCIAGAPARSGVCGDPGCVCAPAGPPQALDERETATVLHALRHLQEWRGGCKGECLNADDPLAPRGASCEHFGAGCRPLSDREIDALCERLNFFDVGARPPAPCEAE